MGSVKSNHAAAISGTRGVLGHVRPGPTEMWTVSPSSTPAVMGLRPRTALTAKKLPQRRQASVSSTLMTVPDATVTSFSARFWRPWIIPITRMAYTAAVSPENAAVVPVYFFGVP